MHLWYFGNHIDCRSPRYNLKLIKCWMMESLKNHNYHAPWHFSLPFPFLSISAILYSTSGKIYFSYRDLSNRVIWNRTTWKYTKFLLPIKENIRWYWYWWQLFYLFLLLKVPYQFDECWESCCLLLASALKSAFLIFRTIV